MCQVNVCACEMFGLGPFLCEAFLFSVTLKMNTLTLGVVSVHPVSATCVKVKLGPEPTSLGDFSSSCDFV